MYDAAIIGCGNIGVGLDGRPDNHLRAYQDCPDTKLVGLADVYPIEHTYGGVPFYLDYKQLFEYSHPDIVSVCTPPETHCKIVCEIAPYVKAIYCEKPIAPTLVEADHMIQVCHQNNVILQVNHQRRFMPVKVRFARGIMNTGTHLFDRLRQLFGEVSLRDGEFFFGNQEVEIEYIDSDEYIFEIDCTRSAERMILKGVDHLVQCLKEKKQSISSGEEGKKTLEMTLLFKEIYERNRASLTN